MTGSLKHIVLATGGTGGHMSPAEALADVLTTNGHSVSLVTDARGASIGNFLAGTDRMVLSAQSVSDGGLVNKVRSALSIIFSTLQVRRVFKKKRPSLVVGFGGYPSLPAVLAARSMGVPYVLHEQNAVLGRVNRYMAKRAKMVALSVEGTKKVPASVPNCVTGNPVRSAIAKFANIAYATPFGQGSIRVFVLGGSQGARILTDVVPEAILSLPEECRSRLDVVHQARPEDIDRARLLYKQGNVQADVESYFDDVSKILLRTQLVICRSGASTLAELTAMGRPAILIPLAIAADDHQTANAEIIRQAGGGIVIKEEDFSPEALAGKLKDLFVDLAELRDWSDGMRSIARLDATQNLMNVVVEASENGKAAV